VKLTDEQKSTLLNALSVAAGRFSDNAKELRRGPPQYDLVAVFEKQEKDTLALLELVQGADSIEVTEAEYSPCGQGDCGPGCSCGGSEP
jgi:hypothetical protein